MASELLGRTRHPNKGDNCFSTSGLRLRALDAGRFSRTPLSFAPNTGDRDYFTK